MRKEYRATPLEPRNQFTTAALAASVFDDNESATRPASGDDSITRDVRARIREAHAPLRHEILQQVTERGDDLGIAAQLEGAEFLDASDAGLTHVACDDARK